jgi:hypothetical protein
MPDAKLILEAMIASALVAAVVLLLSGWPWRSPHPIPVSCGAVLGVALGFFLGCSWLDLLPGWPPREDQDRLLAVLVPVLVVIELAAAFPGRYHWRVWLPRFVLAALAARILLHHTVYLVDLAGPGTREWTPAQTWLILTGLAVALAGTWVALALLAKRAPGRSIPLALSLACAGAALAVMLSGYASGGLIGLPLAGALVGTTVASLVVSGPITRSVLGLGVVGLFSVLMMGRFFGELATSHAVVLFFAPLLCWLPELPLVRQLGPRIRGALRVLLVAVPVVVVVSQAQSDSLGGLFLPLGSGASGP